MQEVKKKIEVGYSQDKLKEKFLRLFRADVGAHISIVGQSEARRDTQEETRNVTLDADHAKAIALMEWQKSRRVSQIL